MNVMVQTVGKRAACDRCHSLKMRCVVEEAGAPSRCNRCRSARVACRYSSPGKPGRPPTKPPGMVTARTVPVGPRESTGARQRGPGAAPQAGRRQSSASSLSPHHQQYNHHEQQYLDSIEVAGYTERTSSIASSAAPVVGEAYPWPASESFAALLDRTPISPPSTFWPDALSLLDEESDAAAPWNSLPQQEDHWAAGKQQSDPHDTGGLGDYGPERQHIHLSHFQSREHGPSLTQSPSTLLVGHSPVRTLSESEPSTSASASSTVTLAPSPTTGHDRQRYLQQLSEFNVRLSNPASLDLESSASQPVNADQLSQAAAHVLETSAIFLDLVQIPSSGQIQGGIHPESEHASGDPSINASATSPFVPDVATRLQLLVSYMRLTELHHSLYTAVYSYLRHPTNTTPSKPGQGERHDPLVALSMAGIALTPHPRFQLQLLLQTSTHYLACIQEALSLPEPLRLRLGFGSLAFDGASGQESAESAMLVHTLVMHDQENRLRGISEVLGRLKDEFNLVT